MKKTALLLFCLIPLLIFAQQPSYTRPVDSAVYYKQQLSQLWRNTYDSVQQSQQYITISRNIERLRGKANSYGGVILAFDICHSDYNTFNQSIARSGFGKLNPLSFRFGFGITNKTNRTLLDIYFAIAGLNNTSKKEDASIKTSLSNVLQFDIGYDILQSQRFSIYPYAGLSLRFSSLEYDSTIQVNNSYTNISNIIANDRSVAASSFRIGYQAGVGFDLLLSKPAQRGAIFLFTKVGVNRPIGNDRYKIEDITYRPEIKQGDYIISVGFKFTSRN